MNLTKAQLNLIKYALWKTTRDGNYYGNRKHFQKNLEKAVFFTIEELNKLEAINELRAIPTRETRKE